MKDRTRFRRACGGKKVKYENQEAARQAAFRVSKRAKTMITYYLCRFCGGWHIGHPPKSVKQSILDRRRHHKRVMQAMAPIPEQDHPKVDLQDLTPEEQERREKKLLKHQNRLKRVLEARLESEWVDSRQADPDLARLSRLVSMGAADD